MSERLCGADLGLRRKPKSAAVAFWAFPFGTPIVPSCAPATSPLSCAASYSSAIRTLARASISNAIARFQIGLFRIGNDSDFPYLHLQRLPMRRLIFG